MVTFVLPGVVRTTPTTHEIAPLFASVAPAETPPFPLDYDGADDVVVPGERFMEA